MSRMIHKSVSSSKKLASLSKESLILFTMLIPHFNAHGKLNGSPNFIKGEVVPRLKWATVPIIEKCLQEISEKTSVKWYVVDELQYLQSLKWTDYQTLRPDRMGDDKLPDYSGSDAGLVPREAKVSISKVKEKSKVKTVSEKIIQEMTIEFPDDDIPKCLQAFYDYIPNAKRPYKDYDKAFTARMRNQYPNIKKGGASGGKSKRTHRELQEFLDAKP